jgi:hypothetical protein
MSGEELRRKEGELHLSGIRTRDKNYLELIQGLPKPTPRQIALFASYVSDAHSWYKHLPTREMVPFHVFLDPHAGEGLATDAEGREVLRPIEDTAGHIHYTAQKTADYRRRLGFWNYDAAYGSSLQYRVGDDIADTSNRGPQIAADNGDWVEIPRHVLDVARAEVNAFVHANAGFLVDWAIQHWHYKLERDPSKFPFSDEALARMAVTDPAVTLPSLPIEIEEAIDGSSETAGLVSGPLWREEQVLDDILSSGIHDASTRDDVFPALLEHLEFRRSCYVLGLRHAADTAPTFDSHCLARVLATRRIRQLRRLKIAMNRLVVLHYGPDSPTRTSSIS